MKGDSLRYRESSMALALWMLFVALLLASCNTIQTAAHYATGGLVPLPTPSTNELGTHAWSAWLTWLGAALGITDPQAQTAVTVAAYSRVDNAVKAAVAAVKGTKRVVAKRKSAKKPPFPPIQ